MVKDLQNDRLSYDAVFESFNLFVSALHHDVSAALRHSNGFATLLQEEADPEALGNWTKQIITASAKGQNILLALTQCMRRALSSNTPEQIEDLEAFVDQFSLSARLSFAVDRATFTDPQKLEDIYTALDEALRLVSSAPETSRIDTAREADRRYLRITGTTPTTAVRESNVERFFTPMKFDQGDRTEIRTPVIFKIKATAAALHGNALASVTPDGCLKIEVMIPDFPHPFTEPQVSTE